MGSSASLSIWSGTSIGYLPVKQARQNFSFGRLTASISPSTLRKPSVSASMCCRISSTVMRPAMSSQRVPKSMPKKQGEIMGGAAMRTCISRAPAFFSIDTTGPFVVPRTMLSSTSTTRRPSSISGSGLNFSRTPISRMR